MRVTSIGRPSGGRTTAQDDMGHAQPRLPHELDESQNSQDSPPRKVIEQAYDDVQAGQEDTDLTATRGRRVRLVPRNRPPPTR
jgi:hypothetical protein